MAEAQLVVESRDAAMAALAAARSGGSADASGLLVPLRAIVPAWLAEVVQAASAQAASVDVLLEPYDHPVTGEPGTEARDGWEIGVITAALSVGVREVLGVDARRVARVRTVVGHLAQAADAPEPTAAATPEVVS